MVFLDSLSPTDARLMMATMGQTQGSLYDLEYMFTFARRLDISIGKKAAGEVNSGSRKRKADESSSGSKEAKKSKWAPSSGGSSGASGSRFGASKGEWVSKFGKTMVEHQAEHSCKDCNGRFAKGLSCGSGGSSSSSPAVSTVVRMMHVRPKCSKIAT